MMTAWRCRDRLLPVGPRTLVMGILNVTPDSFSDGGRYLDPEEAVKHARQMVEEGADIVDIGGESTRPGAEPVSEAEEIRRVVPVIEALAELPAALSVDTMKAAVARAALEAGAVIVNDVSALRVDPAMAALAADAGAGVVLMHMLGEPRTMQRDPRYGDVVAEVAAALAARARSAESAGIGRDQIVVDPGLGFGKTYDHNLALLANVASLHRLGYPVLVGPSRKNAIAAGLRLPVGERVELTAAAVAWAVAHGAAVVRVHDVKEMVRVARMTEAIRDARAEPATEPRDRITVRGLRVFGYHGVNAAEKRNGQDFVVDLEAILDLGPAGRSDDLTRTVDYSELTARATAIVAGERYDLIEALAERLTAVVLEYPGVARAVVRVAKPAALAGRGVEEVSVQIERHR
ncbi:MAG TPA: dihydropteroate synthase [Actinomycetota bacterium]|nr:dihydropteroate synthase [Actinomycetota bacterium]